MKQKLLKSSLLLSTLLAFSPSWVRAGGDNPPNVEIKTTRDLKQFMYKFGTLVAGIEILRAKEKNPDWTSIDLTLKEMKENVEAMQKADKTAAYKGFTDQLSNQLIVLKKMSDKKDPKIYDGFDKLTQTCFQCHAAHRPVDFLKPGPGRKLTEK
ncbi:MAG: hypothetical protein U1F57_08530 [bacterium]